MDRKFIIPGRNVIGSGKNLRKPALHLIIAFVSLLTASSVAWARFGTSAVSISPTSISFGSYTVGTTSAPETLTVTNTGTTTLTFTSIALRGGNSNDFSESNNCGKSLAAKANCLVQVTFKPTASGVRTTSLYLYDYAMNSPQKVTISGSATAVTATVSLSAATFSFGTYVVGATGGPDNLSVTNSGNTTLNITSVTFSGGNAGDFTQTNNCGASLAVGASCLVQVMFQPTAAGTRTTTLYVADNATGSPQPVTFSGIATAATAAASLSITVLSFGNESVGGTSATQAVTLTNTGNAALTVTGITVSGTNASDFGQTNTCGSSLTASASCAISISFKPSAAGARAAIISIADSATGSPQTISLSGTGTSPAISVSPASLSFGNQSVNVASGVQTIALSNTGNAALTISGISISGANAADFSQTNNCGSSVAAGSSCSISVIFTPVASGNRAASLAITDNATGSPQAVNLSGTGTSPAASVSPSGLAFGNQSVNVASGAQTITLSNTGNAALSVTAVSISGTNATDFSQTNNCGSSVAAGVSCAISVIFTPAASGSRTGSLTITDNATGSPQAVSLSGTGATPAASESPSGLAFGNQSVNVASGAQTITLSNTGNAALSVTAISISGTNATDFSQTNNCGLSVAAGVSCAISVIFTPAASGSRAGSLTITENATGSPQAITLTGTGTVSTAGVSPSSLTFGSLSVGTASAAQIVTLNNTGNTALSVTSVSISGTNATDFAETNNCGASVPAGSSCTVSINFTPAAAGSRVASLAIADSATGSPQCITVSGTGTTIPGSATLSPSSVTFSSEAIDMSSPTQTMTLTNTGTTALTISGIAIAGTNSSDFTQNNNCGSSVAAGATCTIVMQFTPAAVGVRAATISISDNAASTPQTAALSGTGTHDVLLSWSASSSSNVSGYYVYRGTTSGKESSTPLNSTPICVTAYADQSVTSGSQYYYIVTSVSSDGVTQSAASTETAATIPSP